MIDRLAPAQRPNDAAQGYQRWRSLLFLHWQVPVNALRPLIPQELSLDLYNGIAFVGVVPFLMRGVRPRWLPKKLGFNFLETNVRTYVCCNGQPGVFFFSLEASSRLAVWAARTGWGLPYHYAKMKHTRDGEEIFYQSHRTRKGPQHEVRYKVGELIGPSQPDTLEHFLLERYLLFVKQRQQILVGQVHHEPYPAQRVEVLDVRDQLVQAAGLPHPTDHPFCAHFSEGVDVEVFALRKP